MKNKIFTIIALLVFFTIFFFMNPEYTGFTTASNQTNGTVIEGYRDLSDEAELTASYLINKFSYYTDSQKEIESFLGYDIDTIISQVENYQLQIQNIINSTIPNQDKTSQLEIIKPELENLKKTTPLVKVKQSIKNLPTPRAKTIPDIYLLENQRFDYIKQEVIKLQSRINIKTDLIDCEITIGNITEDVTLIKKTISGSLTDFYLIEEIPKSIASSIGEIEFGIDNYEIIQEDPIVRWSVSSLPVTITYLVPDNILDSYTDLTTTVIPKTISFEPAEKYKRIKCGDGICTAPLEDKTTCPEDCMKKVNWWFVIILFALLIGGIYYLNFYRGKMSFKEVKSKVTHKEKTSLFKTKADEINLRNYVRKSLAHDIPKSRIRTILLTKGWSEKQINHIFKTI